jgi:phosphoenolpyruvate carboxykinase (ATP)
MPLAPTVYAELLKKYTTKYRSNVYLVNTGWGGGPYGIGKRISIKDTRAIIRAILDGSLDSARYHHLGVFNLDVPAEAPGVDPSILDPQNSWADKNAYREKAQELARMFAENFKRFKGASLSVISAGPTM